MVGWINPVLAVMRSPPAIAAMVLLISASAAGAQNGAGAAGIDAGAGDDVPDLPIPGNAQGVYSPIGSGFDAPLRARGDLLTPPGQKPQPKKPPPPMTEENEEVWLELMRERLDNAGPFVSDTNLEANSRTYWLERKSVNGSHPEALTTGGSLSYESGYAGGFLQLRGALYTTQPLYAPHGEGTTLNLTPDQGQITTLGQANVRLRLEGQDISVGRQLVRTAFLNPDDTRMIPLTFEGMVLVPERKPDQGLDYIASYLTSYKPRDSANFISMSEPFGVARDEGMLIDGVRYRSDRFNAGAVNYWIKDVLNTAYGELDYLLPFGGGDNGPSWRVSVNDLDQRSVGEELMPGPGFHTDQTSTRLVASYAGFVGAMAGSATGREADIRDPFGNLPVYTSMHQSSFERAGEKAYLATLSYDFSNLGFAGLSLLGGFGQGFDAIDPVTGASVPNRNLWELYLDYEPESGLLDGFRVQLYYSDERLIHADLPRDNQMQFRAVLNYPFSLL